MTPSGVISRANGRPGQEPCLGVSPGPAGAGQARPKHRPQPAPTPVGVGIGRAPQASAATDYNSLKLTTTSACIGIATRSFMPGLNLHCFTASTAFSSRPRPRLRLTWMSTTLPSLSTVIKSTTVPEYLAFRAGSEYSGSNLYCNCGNVTPGPGVLSATLVPAAIVK